MSKILTVGVTEYLNAVRSKAFIIGLILMPVMMSGSVIVQTLIEDSVDLTERNFAVLDETGKLYDVLDAAILERNESVFEFEDAEEAGGDEPERVQRKPLFEIEAYEHPEDLKRSPELVLSDRVRDGDLFAFVVIEKGAFKTKKNPSDLVAYYSASPTYEDLPRWIRSTIQDEVERSRFDVEGLDPDLVDELTKNVHFNTLSLIEESEDGQEIGGKEDNDVETKLIPLASMFLLFMMVMMSAPQGLNVVLEEKMQKISEVLVSAVTPYELMMGKLVGTIFLAMTLSGLYLGGIAIATTYFGVNHMVPGQIYAWFMLFQLMALAIYSSLFAAIGAACSEMRDAQTLMTPAMIVLMIPMFFVGVVLDSPHGDMATAISLFPPATPMIMLMRVSIAPGPPMWQLITSLILTTGFTIGCVWAAGKVFRIGLLSTGQAPSFKKLLGWVFSK